MRVRLWYGIVASFGILLGVACSSTSIISQQAAPEDGGTSSGASGGLRDGGGGDGGSTPQTWGNGVISITPSKLRDGATVLVGVTSDDYVVYLAEGSSSGKPTLEVVSPEGGSPEVLAPSFDINNDLASVSGGAVAWWNAVNADGLTGTINLWTKKNGKKVSLNTSSQLGDFVASEDGARVAFSVKVDGDLGNFVVADSATVAAPLTGMLADADRINLAAANLCLPQFSFVKQTFLAAFCIGTAPLEDKARLYYVGPVSTTLTRLDDVGPAAGPVAPFFFTDKEGTRIFAISPGGTTTGRLITAPNGASPASSVVVEDGTASTGFMSDDGNYVIYRTSTGGIRHALTSGAPTPKTLAANAKGILGITSDHAHMVYRTLPADLGTDLRSADTATENQTGVALVATATATLIGMSGTGKHVLYLTEAGTSNNLKSQPLGGGTAKDLAQSLAGIAIAPVGDGALLRVLPRNQGEITYTSILYMNVVTGDTSPIISDAVPAGGIGFTKKKLVYTRLSQATAGLYAAPYP